MLNGRRDQEFRQAQLYILNAPFAIGQVSAAGPKRGSIPPSRAECDGMSKQMSDLSKTESSRLLAHVLAKWVRFADKDMRQRENLRRFAVIENLRRFAVIMDH
jgi:hypothetical protein